MKKNKKRKFNISPKTLIISPFCNCGQERGSRFGKDNNQCSRCWKPLD